VHASQQPKFDGRISGTREDKSTSLEIETLSQYIYVDLVDVDRPVYSRKNRKHGQPEKKKSQSVSETL
jgi:hypothetical protein